MNHGERNELLFKIYLCRLKHTKETNTIFGEIKNCGFEDVEYLPFDQDINLNKIDDHNLKILATSLNITKSPSNAKADVRINDRHISIKSLNSAPPSIVNHTSRVGFKIANHLNLDISELDNQISKYWELRKSGIISEIVVIIIHYLLLKIIK